MDARTDAPAAPAGQADLRALWAQDPLETSIFVGLLAGLSWAPFWLGGDRPIAWGVNGLLFPALAVAYELALLARGRRHPVGARRLALPIGLFVLVALWILTQMSSSAPPAIVHPIWAMASDVLGRPLEGAISVDPGATALAFLRLLTDASALWLSIQLCRNPQRAYLLLRWIGATVAAYSLYGILLTAFYGGAIPLFDVAAGGGPVRATFVNRNNFATYAGLGLIAIVGLILRLYRHDAPDAAGLSSYRLTRLIEATGRRGWLLLGSGFVILAALLGSVSRGGILASALGLFALILLSVSRQRRRRGEQIEAIVFVTLAVVACFAMFGDLIVGRIASVGLDDVSRLAVYQIVARAILDAPLLGFGYGAFADVFPMYRDNSIGNVGVWDMAHNSYLETWLGLGLVAGTLLMAALGALVAQCFVGAIKRRRDATPAIVASACALVVGVHALVDFSLQIEAVTLTFMGLLGAGVAESASSRTQISD